MNNILKYIVIFIILILIFNLLLLLSSLSPSYMIYDNVRESSQVLLQEGNIYFFSDYSNISNNNYTDAIMINECYSIDNNDPIFSYMSARKNYNKKYTVKELPDISGELISTSSSDEYDPVGELSEFLDGEVYTSIEYARYWHGYLIVLRVLLLFFNITEIRHVFLFLFLVLFLWLIILLKKKIGNTIAIIFGFSLLAEGYFFVSYSLESMPIFTTMMLSCIILLYRLEKVKNFYLYIFIIACITNFVDFLTVPLISLAIPLYIYLLYKQKKEDLSLKASLKLVIHSCVVWGLGYGLTWISKWIIYDIFYNRNLIKSAISQILYRTSSTNPLANITIRKCIVGIFI